MTTAADELRAATEALRPELSGREIILPSGAIISRTLAAPLALLLEAVASNALEDDHEECRSYCTPETCDVAAALTLARQINTGSQT